MHPEAVRQGKRFLGTQECGEWFDRAKLLQGVADGEPDASAMHDFLMDPANPLFYWLGIDPHDSSQRNANALLVGGEFKFGQLAVAAVMDLDKVIVLRDYPFFNFMQKFVGVETEYDPVANPLSQPAFWHKCLKRMVELGPQGMEELGRDVYQDLRYFEKFELARVDATGKTCPGNKALIERFSRIDVADECFAPVDLTGCFDDSDIPLPEGNVYAESWGDRNNSTPRPDLGHHEDGRPFREFFGALLLEVDPPEPVPGSEPRDGWRKYYPHQL